MSLLGVAASWLDLRRQSVWRALVISLVLIGALAFSLRPMHNLQNAILIGLPALAVVLVCLRYPSLGLLLVIVLGQLLPFTLGTGTGTRLNPAVLLVLWLLVVWFLRMVVRREASLSPYLPIPLTFLLLLAVAVALAVGQIRWYPISGASLASQLGGVAVYVTSLGALLLSAHQINDLKWLRRMVYTVFAIGAVYLGSLITWRVGGRFIEQYFTSGALGSLFWVWLVALAAGEILFNANLTPGKRLALAGLIAATFYVRIVTGGEWASGWLPAIVALLVVIWGRYRRLGWAGIVVLLAAFIANSGGLLQAVAADEYGNLFPWEARTAAWRVVLQATSVNPIFGLGPSNYYYYVRLFPLPGWQSTWFVPFSSHNNFVDIYAQFGLVGLALFAGLIVSLGREIWLLRRRVTDDFERGFIYAALGGLVGSLIAGLLGDWFLPFVYNIGIAGVRSSVIMWLFLGSVLAIRRRYDQASAPPVGDA